MNNPNQIVLNNIEFTFVENEWIWKALPFNVTKKSSHKERPQIKAVEKIESDYQKLFDATLIDITKYITKYLMKQ